MEAEVPSMSAQELTSAQHRSSANSALAQQPMSEHQEFIVESRRKEMQSGWASYFLTEEKCMSCSRRAGALRLLLFTSGMEQAARKDNAKAADPTFAQPLQYKSA